LVERKNSNYCCGGGQRRKTGEGQVVLLSGEAGIGKSRFKAALRIASQTNRTRSRYFCSPQHIDRALYPIKPGRILG
jgi:predicted ATPase